MQKKRSGTQHQQSKHRRQKSLSKLPFFPQISEKNNFAIKIIIATFSYYKKIHLKTTSSLFRYCDFL